MAVVEDIGCYTAINPSQPAKGRGRLMDAMIKRYFNSLADVLAASSKSASFNQHRPDSGLIGKIR